MIVGKDIEVNIDNKISSKKFLPRIKQNTDAVVNITTGGGLGMSVDERIAAAVVAEPEVTSLNMGSMNFGIFNLAKRY